MYLLAAYHACCSLIGVLVLSYELTNGRFLFFFTFSSWFGVATTVTHAVQIFVPIWDAIGLTLTSFACFFMMPSALFTITTPEETFARWLLNDVCLHAILPVCALTHTDGILFRGPWRPIIFSCASFLAYVVFIETVASPLPYHLNQYHRPIRILFYVCGFVIQCLGILFITHLPYFSKKYFIRV